MSGNPFFFFLNFLYISKVLIEMNQTLKNRPPNLNLWHAVLILCRYAEDEIDSKCLFSEPAVSMIH